MTGSPSIRRSRVRSSTTRTTSAQPPNAFIGKTVRPSDSDLATALGAAKLLWDRVIAELAADLGVAIQEWRSYSPKMGWALRLKRGKRTIVWLAPHAGSFQVLFILGDRAVSAVRQGGVPARVLQLLDEAPRYPEGTGLRLRIRTARDLRPVKQLAAIKLQN